MAAAFAEFAHARDAPIEEFRDSYLVRQVPVSGYLFDIEWSKAFFPGISVEMAAQGWRAPSLAEYVGLLHRMRQVARDLCDVHARDFAAEAMRTSTKIHYSCKRFYEWEDHNEFVPQVPEPKLARIPKLMNKAKQRYREVKVIESRTARMNREREEQAMRYSRKAYSPLETLDYLHHASDTPEQQSYALQLKGTPGYLNDVLTQMQSIMLLGAQVECAQQAFAMPVHLGRPSGWWNVPPSNNTYVVLLTASSDHLRILTDVRLPEVRVRPVRVSEHAYLQSAGD